MNDSERLRIILEHRGIILRPVTDNYSAQARRIQNEIDAMAEVLEFKINWSHDSRPLEDIITDGCSQLPNCCAVMLEKVKLLRTIQQRELDFYNAVYDTEIKKYD